MKKRMFCFIMMAILCVGTMVGCAPADEEKKEDVRQEAQSDETDGKVDEEAGGEGKADDGEITKTITLSGSYYSGKVVIVLEINPDGTVSGEGNGEEMTGTWKMSEDKDSYIEASARDGELNFVVTKEADGSYTATVEEIVGMTLTGK